GRDLERHRAEIDLHEAVDAEGNDHPQPRALQGHQAAQPEEDATFVFVDDPDRRAQADEDDENDDAEDDESENAHESLPSLTRRCRRVHVTGHIIRAFGVESARVMRTPPAALPTAPPAVVA